MTVSFLSLIDISSVTKRNVLNDFRERSVTHLNDQVNVVAHETECMQSARKAFRGFLQKQQEFRTVGFSIEDILPTVAAQNYMIRTAWNMKSRFSCHEL